MREENQKLEKAQHSLQQECKQLKEELQTAVSEKAVLVEELKKHLQDKVIVLFSCIIIGSYVIFSVILIVLSRVLYLFQGTLFLSGMRKSS